MDNQLPRPDEKFIDVGKVIRKKNPRLARFLPRFAVRVLERIIEQDMLNRVFNDLRGTAGVEMFRAYTRLPYINLSFVAHGLEHIKPEGRYVYAANHPLGGPESVLLTLAVDSVQPSPKFIVNDILTSMPNSESLFIPVNKHGANSKEYARIFDQAFAENHPLLIFPAGMVSRRQGREVRDLPWKGTFVKKAFAHKRDIVPVFVDGLNTKFFYGLAHWRKKLGIKANIEMLFLVKELFKHRNKTIHLYFGKPIPWQTFDRSKPADAWAEELRTSIYTIKNNSNPVIG